MISDEIKSAINSLTKEMEVATLIVEKYLIFTNSKLCNES